MYKIAILIIILNLSCNYASAGKLSLYDHEGAIYISNLDKPALPKIADKKGIQNLIILKARNNRIDPNLLMAIAKVESDFNPNAVSNAGAIGLMQVKPETAKRFGIDKNSLYDPELNLEASIRYIKFLIKRFHKKSLVIASYYGGENSIVKNKIVGPKAINYLKSIIKWESYFKSRGI
ncbi:MAG: lytic transglycosylase domain-containing protein [Epsilonproteobacteria bacterium]|nr:lytic transglycosylase domain-containing protein [Campylobacterota bacterium]